MADDNLISGNYIGTNADGDAAIANGSTGVVLSFATGTTIGGTVVGMRNVISGNFYDGIFADTAQDTVLEGNFIGTNASGTSAIPNGLRGITLYASPGTRVGGSDDRAGNLVSGNTSTGIGAYQSADYSIIGNLVGTAADGESPIGNGGDGIELQSVSGSLISDNVTAYNSLHGINLVTSDDNELLANRVGVTAQGNPGANAMHGVFLLDSSDNVIGNAGDAGNTIANNGASGLRIDGGDPPVRILGGGAGGSAIRNTIRGNSIHSNSDLGIDNVSDGNEELPPPVITGPDISGTACANCVIDVYSDDVDEGRVYEGSTVANGGGVWSFTESVSGPFTTATATDSDGNTSEFSGHVVSPPPFTPTPTLEPTPTAAPTATPASTPTPGPTETAGPTPGLTKTPEPEAVQGDTDCDEDVDSVDGLFVLRDVAGFEPSKCIDSGDVDCDEDRDSVDALGILRHVAALPPLVQQEPCADIGTPA